LLSFLEIWKMAKAAGYATSLAVVLSVASGCFSLSPGSRPWTASVEEALLFHPQPFPKGNWTPEPNLFEDVWIETADGVSLHGWFAEARPCRCAVLYCHGNAGNITSRREVLRLFRDRLNCSVLVFDYRGYGRSDGTPTEQGLLQDARAARRWLADRVGVDENDIVLVGNSLGGGVAVDLAAHDGAAGLVLENTFTSVPDTAAHHFWWLPVRQLAQTKFDSLAKIRSYNGPLLQTHGDADRVIPFELGCRLFEAANPPKEFIHVPGGGHNDLPRQEYIRALDRFLTTRARESRALQAAGP
jgi:fermentation-respiration switch protein FrsA (DUF1100 family)